MSCCLLVYVPSHICSFWLKELITCSHSLRSSLHISLVHQAHCWFLWSIKLTRYMYDRSHYHNIYLHKYLNISPSHKDFFPLAVPATKSMILLYSLPVTLRTCKQMWWDSGKPISLISKEIILNSVNKFYMGLLQLFAVGGCLHHDKNFWSKREKDGAFFFNLACPFL